MPLCVYVDKNRILANDKAALKEFEAAFNKWFPGPLLRGPAGRRKQRLRG